jgi:hypothetical protein
LPAVGALWIGEYSPAALYNPLLFYRAERSERRRERAVRAAQSAGATWSTRSAQAKTNLRREAGAQPDWACKGATARAGSGAKPAAKS